MKRIQRKIGLLPVLLIMAMLWPECAVLALEAENMSDEDAVAGLALQRNLDSLTTLAAKTFLNTDHVPGIVTILYGDDLSALGIRTVGEALELVPGVYLSHERKTFWKTVIRGVPRSFAPGALKFLLNGAPISSSFGIDAIPNMPIDQVARLEFIRGPGSAVHGEFACAGVMNIITRTQGNRLSTGVGSHDLLTAGAVLSYRRPDQNLDLTLNVQEYRIEGADINIGPGLLSAPQKDDSGPIYQGPENQGQTYPPTNAGDAESPFQSTAMPFDQERQYRAGVLSLEYQQVAAKAYWLENGQHGLYDTRHWGVAAGLEVPVRRDIQAKLSLGVEHQRFDSQNPGYYAGDAKDFFSSGWVYGFAYNERIFFGGLELCLQNFRRHRALLGIQWLHSDLADVMRPEAPDTVFSGRRRTVYSLLLQDEFQLHDRFRLAAGLRYDDYDDIGAAVSPRLAGVYRLTSERRETAQQLIKLQYARAFRPPTFLETEAIYQTSDLDFETIDTWEISYIFKHYDTGFRATAFYSDLDARIDASQFRPEPGRFQSYGVEVELETRLDCLRINAHLSRIWAENRDSGRKIGESAQWLGNLNLALGPFYGVTLHLRERLAAGRQPVYADDSDGRSDPPDYAVTDVSLTIARAIKGLKIQAGVKNIFAADVRSRPAEYAPANNRPEINDHDPDESGAERGFWVKLIHEF